MKKYKKLIFASMLIISYIFITHNPVLASSNILTHGYGFSYLDTAPRVTRNKNYSMYKNKSTDDYIAFYVHDDKKLKIHTSKSFYSDGYTDNYINCFIPQCSNPMHNHVHSNKISKRLY